MTKDIDMSLVLRHVLDYAAGDIHATDFVVPTVDHANFPPALCSSAATRIWSNGQPLFTSPRNGFNAFIVIKPIILRVLLVGSLCKKLYRLANILPRYHVLPIPGRHFVAQNVEPTWSVAAILAEMHVDSVRSSAILRSLC
jgi:hypothetical protein